MNKGDKIYVGCILKGHEKDCYDATVKDICNEYILVEKEDGTQERFFPETKPLGFEEFLEYPFKISESRYSNGFALRCISNTLLHLYASKQCFEIEQEKFYKQKTLRL